MNVDKFLARVWVKSYDGVTEVISRRLCFGLYDGNRLDALRAEHSCPVILAIPPMSDVNGALPHPGVHILQRVLRHQGIGLSLIHISEPTRLLSISYAVFCL